MTDLKPIFDEVRKLSQLEFLAILLSVTSIFCPGVLTICLFAPLAAMTMSTPKMLVIAMSVVVPFVWLDSVLFLTAFLRRMDERGLGFGKVNPLVHSISHGAWVALVTFGLALLVAFFFQWSAKSFAALLLAEQLLTSIVSYQLGSKSELLNLLPKREIAEK